MIKKIVFCLLAAIFHFVPRNEHLWVTGKVSSWEYINTPPSFFDNSKYFFLYLVNNTNEKVYWISSSQKEIDMLKKMNLPVVNFWSLKGIWLVLRAKFSFHHYGPGQINNILQFGSIQIDFWHGAFKKIRYDVVGVPKPKYNSLKEWLDKDGMEYIASFSSFFSEKVLMGAFAAKKEQMLEFAYPRLDVLGLCENDNLKFCNKYSRDLLKYIEKVKGFQKVFLYMPTWRDDDPDYIEKAGIDYDLLSDKLKEIDGIFFFKLHPLTRHTPIMTYDNIVQIENDVDIYPFLTYTNYLITDYSSIFFDYLLLDKEIIFLPFDYDNYLSHRQLYFDYDKITPGEKYYSFIDFIDNLDKVDDLDYKKERRRIKELIIGEFNYDACDKTYKFIRERYQ